MLNPIKEIVRFNREAGLLDQGYDDFRESSFQIEEALEGFPNLAYLERVVNYPDVEYEDVPTTAKHVSRQIITIAERGCYTCDESYTISDVDRLDKACDAVVFAVGSMAKLGLNPQEITRALNIVMKANFAKLNCPKDEFGKLTKPVGFVGPEPELQALLDRRSSK